MRFVWMLQITLVMLGPSIAFALVHKNDPQRAVRGAGLVLAAVYLALFGVFVIGETFADPGGWEALGLVAAWVVPAALVSLLAWQTPQLARPVLVALVVALGGVYLWSAVAPEAWRSFEDDSGPVRGVLALALTAPLAVHAIRHTREAGWLLLTVGALPFAAALAVELTGGTAMATSVLALDLPLLIIGALLVVSTRLVGVPTGGAAGAHPPGIAT